MEAKTLFASKEVEEETRKVSPKKFVPAEDTEMAEEQKTPKVVAPTQDQINAIKVIIGIKFFNSQSLVIICSFFNFITFSIVSSMCRLP